MSDWGVAHYLHVIIMPAQQAIVADIEGLLGAMRGDVWRKRHLETPPGFALLLPRIDLPGFEPGPGQGEGEGQIGPYRIASKVERMQLIPWSLRGMASESGAGVSALLDDRSFVSLDGDTVWGEDRLLVRKFERREGGVLLVQIDGSRAPGSGLRPGL
jgi:hypothetical protein